MVAPTAELDLKLRLRDIRKRQVMSQEELAAAAGVARSTIVRLEKGEAEPNFVTLRKLAAALKVDARDLIDES